MEDSIRLIVFLAVLGGMAAWEVASPWRRAEVPRLLRWSNNLALVVLDAAVVRLVFPVTAVAVATWAEAAGWGVLALLGLPLWVAAVLAFVLLDLAIWAQHRVFHAVPMLWLLHRVHHADPEIDVTTGVRFHPAEIVLMLYPMVANVLAMGAALPFVYVPMPITDFALMGVIALFGFGAGLLVIKAYRTAPAIIVAPMQYSQILWAAGYGALLFDESVDLFTAIGSAIIIASGIYIVLREGTPQVSGHRPVLGTKSRPETGSMPRVSVMMQRLGIPERSE